MKEDTIAAIATPPGEGGVGIIRISGEDAGEVLQRVFSRGSICVSHPRSLIYGHIRDGEKFLDEALCVFFPAPKTYTTEDVAELQVHGGYFILSSVLELVLKNGARLAEAGEFTKRAFLNGRLDLSQSEAVMDLVSAKGKQAGELALEQLQGRFSAEIRELRKRLMDVLVDLEVNIDYPDEDIEEMSYKELGLSLTTLTEKIKKLIDSADAGRMMKDGIKIAIVGKPNVGKSSLMNALLREKRSIVTAIPGTTRDTIREYAFIKGFPVYLADTAGIRQTEDRVEKIGIDLSVQALQEADICLFMLDLSKPFDEEDQAILEKLDRNKTVFLFNKADKEKNFPDLLCAEIAKNAPFLRFSLLQDGTAAAEELLYQEIKKRLRNRFSSGSDVVVTNMRHKKILEEGLTALTDALSGVRAKEPFELIEIDVRHTYESLGFIIGDAVQDDVLEEVFSRFCLGK